jgi:hypothetical protein
MELLTIEELQLGVIYKAVRVNPYSAPAKEDLAYLFAYNGGTLTKDTTILFTDSDGEKRQLTTGSLSTLDNSAFKGYRQANTRQITHYYATMGMVFDHNAINKQIGNIAHNHFNFMP